MNEPMVRVVAAARDLVAAVDAEEGNPFWHREGALGHCHRNPPMWDDPKLGICRRCEVWGQLRAALIATEPIESEQGGER